MSMIITADTLDDFQKRLRDDNVPRDEKNRITTMIYLYLKKRRLKRMEDEEE